MNRSNWKSPILDTNLYQNTIKKYDSFKPQVLNRAQVLVKNLENKTVLVHNGYSLISLQVTKPMLGFVAGDFVLTRKMRVLNKKKKSKRR